VGPRLTEADRATLDEATKAVSSWLLLEPTRFSVLHGDYRLDNLLTSRAAHA
jgi:aminoglycoside phosphotransferase (APT) family kinase protein